uniref:VENN motif pre-toxin domain-containing protein n=1 Tax=Proteus mirabilis TaxID=584 RepID=UPI002A2463C5|nr:VENN motif pre-toxin domain-containing protein [Proteus mirabilis]
MGTGGTIGSQLVTNAAGGLLSNANNSGHAEGTTQSAVSDGSVIVRNEDKQKQDINKLNRDTEHANDGSINPIFDKEKEQNRLKQAQLIGEIGNQAMDIIRTEGEIAGYKAQKDPNALAIAKKQLEAAGKTPTEQAIKDQAYNNAMAQYGTGSDFQKAAQAVTGLLQGLAGDNLAGALANASSPYLATLIKQQVGEENKAANAMTHAVLGAVVAELNNQSATAGGLGAGGGELSAHVILNTLFPGKKISDLTESEKQQVSALSQLAAGLAGGLTTGDMAGAITGSQAGKNAVENNALSDLVEAQAAGKTPQKVAEERINAEIERYKKENCAGMSTGACSAKMAEDRDKFFREAASLGIDFVPVVGDFKSFAEADGWIDYTLAAAGTLPFAKIFTKPLKEAKLLLKAGDLDGANKLIKEASDGIPTKLPSNPTSQSSSGTWKPNDSKINAGKYQISNGSPNAIDKSKLANPITQSRINVQNGDSKAGWEHVIKRHFSGNSNASQFTISESELKSLLQNPEVVKIPISKTQTSLNKATGKEEILYQRTIILDKQIGIDKFSNGPTNKMTILTDKHGNLVTATPGVIN